VSSATEEVTAAPWAPALCLCPRVLVPSSDPAPGERYVQHVLACRLSQLKSLALESQADRALLTLSDLERCVLLSYRATMRQTGYLPKDPIAPGGPTPDETDAEAEAKERIRRLAPTPTRVQELLRGQIQALVARGLLEPSSRSRGRKNVSMLGLRALRRA